MKHARADYDDRFQDAAGIVPADEPVLLIRGQDRAAVKAAVAWANEHDRLGGDPALSKAVRLHATRILEWQRDHGSKVADAPPGVLS
jgi:hypothetical protein